MLDEVSRDQTKPWYLRPSAIFAAAAAFLASVFAIAGYGAVAGNAYLVLPIVRPDL